MKYLILRPQNQKWGAKFLFLFEVLNKFFGFIKNIIISWWLGFGVANDTYFLISTVCNSVASVFSGAISSSFIPYSQNYVFSDRRRILGGSFLILFPLVSFLSIFIISVLIYFSGDTIKNYLRSDSKIIFVVFLFAISMTLIQFVVFVDELFKSKKNFWIGGLLLLFINILTSLLLLVFFKNEFSFNYLGLAFFLPVLIVFCWILFSLKLPKLGLKISIPFLKSNFPLLVSASVGVFAVIIDRFFSTNFDEGRLSIMQTALIFSTQIGGVLINPLINSAYPFFSQEYNEERFIDAQRRVLKLEWNVLFLIIFIFLAFYNFGESVVAFLYGNGSVKQNDINEIYYVSLLYFPLFFYSAFTGIYLKVLYANKIFKEPAIFSTIVIVFNIILNFIFIDYFGWKTLIYTSVFCSSLYLCLILILIKSKNICDFSILKCVMMFMPLSAYCFL